MNIYQVAVPRSQPMREIMTVKQVEGKWVMDYDSHGTWGEVGYFLRQASGRSVGDAWKPVNVAPIVGNQQAAIADFSFLGAGNPLALSPHANSLLKDKIAKTYTTQGEPLGSTGELLPLNGVGEIAGETFYLFHPPYVDVLNEAESSVSRSSETRIHNIYLHSFYPDKLKDLWLFCIKDYYLYYYVTEQFKTFAEEAGLTNLYLRPVWDGSTSAPLNPGYEPAVWENILKEVEAQRRDEAEPVPEQEVQAPVITESPIDAELMQNIKDLVAYAVTVVRKHQKVKISAEDEPKVIVQAIVDATEKLRHKRLSAKDREKRAIELGLLYEQQFVRAYGWHWGELRGVQAPIAPDGSAYVNGINMVHKLLSNPQHEQNLQLLFNMMAVPRPELKAGGYALIG